MSDELDQMKPSEIDKVFALEVAGWTEFLKKETVSGDEPAHEYWYWRTADGRETACPDQFSSDANSVMPYLEKAGHPDWGRDAEFSKGTRWNGWRIVVGDAMATTPTFARSAAIALIRAARASR